MSKYFFTQTASAAGTTGIGYWIFCHKCKHYYFAIYDWRFCPYCGSDIGQHGADSIEEANQELEMIRKYIEKGKKK